MKAPRVRLFALAIAVTATLAACSDSSSTEPSSSVLPVRTLDAGEVEVKITPTQLDSTGATFSIILDTHSADLSVDLTSAAVLDVGGTAWTVETWTGDGPAGHHRAGELRFIAKGPAEGTAVLTISGLPEPVEVDWEVGKG